MLMSKQSERAMRVYDASKGCLDILIKKIVVANAAIKFYMNLTIL